MDNISLVPHPYDRKWWCKGHILPQSICRYNGYVPCHTKIDNYFGYAFEHAFSWRDSSKYHHRGIIKNFNVPLQCVLQNDKLGFKTVRNTIETQNFHDYILDCYKNQSDACFEIDFKIELPSIVLFQISILHSFHLSMFNSYDFVYIKSKLGDIVRTILYKVFRKSTLTKDEKTLIGAMIRPTDIKYKTYHDLKEITSTKFGHHIIKLNLPKGFSLLKGKKKKKSVGLQVLSIELPYQTWSVIHPTLNWRGDITALIKQLSKIENIRINHLGRFEIKTK